MVVRVEHVDELGLESAQRERVVRLASHDERLEHDEQVTTHALSGQVLNGRGERLEPAVDLDGVRVLGAHFARLQVDEQEKLAYVGVDEQTTEQADWFVVDLGLRWLLLLLLLLLRRRC